MSEEKMKILSFELANLQELCADLEEELETQRKQNLLLKQRCSDLSVRNHELELEINDLKFTHKFLCSEDAGKELAKSLLGGA